MGLISFGKYQIRRELGRGSMGVVYEALDPSRGVEVALKIIGPQPGATPEQRRAQVRRFETEAEVLARLCHPGVVRLLEQGQIGGRRFFAMELVRGTTLRDRIRYQGPLSVSELVRLALELCEALEHLRQHDVVHRDVKPENIMLLPSGSAVLMDFGIACVREDRRANNGGFQGSPSYMSPEQVAGLAVDHSSDLYSLAVTLYEAATARRAAEGETIPEITHRVAYETPPPPAGLPPYFQAVLLRALAKEPRLRYASAAEMSADLRLGRLADGLAAPPQPTASPPRARTMLGVPPPGHAGEGPWAPAAIYGEVPATPPAEGWSGSIPEPGSAPGLGGGTAARCAEHPEQRTIGACAECGCALCYRCMVEPPGRGMLCRRCAFGTHAG
jgi:serine/threonine protein kinase